MASFGESHTFEYNAQGLRIRKNSKHYVLDGDKILKESDGTNTITYYHGNSGVIGFNYNGTDYYYRKNILGDVLDIYNTNGTKVASYAYDAWGNHEITLNSNNIGAINPIRYRGYYFDTETGLYYLQSRYYDPETGRFINADAIEYLMPNQVMGLNLYAYCGNRPTKHTDHSGTWWDEFVEFWEDIWEKSKNKDGTHSLHDNLRYNPKSDFHEQIFVVDPIGSDESIIYDGVEWGVGGSFTVMTGGWEYDNLDISLLDFLQVSAGVSLSERGLDASIGASIWSPSITFNAFGGDLSIGFNVGVKYGFKSGKSLDFGVFSFAFSPN